MSNRIEVKVGSSDEAMTNVWMFETLEVHAGETIHWETGGRGTMLFFPGKSLFLGHEEERVFEIEATPGAFLDLTVKPETINPGEARIIPYAAFYSLAGPEEEMAIRAKMIIRRSMP